MINDVVVEQLNVARFECRMQANFLGNGGQHVQCLVLRRTQPWDPGHFLGLFDIGARILAGDPAARKAESRHGEDIIGRQIVFIRWARPPVTLAQQRDHVAEIGMISQRPDGARPGAGRRHAAFLGFGRRNECQFASKLD